MVNEMSGDRYSVQMLGRAGLRYSEEDRSVFIHGEMSIGRFDFVVHANSIRVWEVSGAPISEEKRQEIIANIRDLFRKNGMNVDVEF